MRNERVARLSLPLQTWIPLSESAEAGQERGSRRRPSRLVYVSAAVPSEDIQSQTSDSKKKKIDSNYFWVKLIQSDYSITRDEKYLAVT